MPTRAAGENANVFEALPYVIAEFDVFEVDGIRVERKSSKYRVLDGDGLLVNLLEHEMLVAALFRHDGIPRDVLELGLAFLTGDVEQADAVTCHDGNFVIVEKQNGPGVRKHCWNVGSNEALAIDGADD